MHNGTGATDNHGGMRTLAIRVALLAALLFAGAQSAAAETFHFAAGDLRVGMTPAIPGGRLSLPLGPIGELTWTTHTGPVNLEVQFLIGASADALPTPEQFRDLRLAFVLRKLPWLLLLGAIGGLLIVTHGTLRRRAVAAAIGAGGLLTAVTISFAIVGLTFDADRLADPHYRGPIKDAPRILQLLKEVQRDWAGVERNINRAVAGLQRLHTQVVTDAPGPQADTVRLLLISDIHNNPLGLLIAQELSRRFEVDGILNAGDFTDRGTALEGALFARFADMELPQAIVAGNHEDRATLQRAREISNALVLGSDEAQQRMEIGGISILGEADPNAAFISSDPFNEVAEEEVPILCEGLRAAWEAEPATVVLVHDPRLGACAAESAAAAGAKLVLAWGHLHEPSYERNGTVLSVSPGTSGAAGFKSDVVLPYGFTLLEFDADTGNPVSVCQFAFASPSELESTSCHIVSGRLFPIDVSEPTPSPSPDTTVTSTPASRAEQ